MNTQTKHGILKEIIGPGLRRHDIEIFPARVQLQGPILRPEFGISEFLQGNPAGSDAVRLWCKKNVEAIWVLGRLLYLFKLPLISEADRCEKTMMEYQFVSMIAEGNVLAAYPFTCSDYYGSTNLCFGSSFDDHKLKQRIAAAFWGLVLAGTEVRDYNSEMYHAGGGFNVRFGINSTIPYYLEDGDASTAAHYEDLLRKLKKAGLGEPPG